MIQRPEAERAAVLRANPLPRPETKRDWSGSRSHQASKEVSTWRKRRRCAAPGEANNEGFTAESPLINANRRYKNFNAE